MPIKPITTHQEIMQYLEERIQRNEKVIINTLAYVGETCIKTARIAGNYKDQTGNLRSSIGYVIVKNGSVVFTSGFATEKRGTEGASAGKKFAGEVSGQFPKGLVLIVVAGMKYAAHVSAMGYDVLDSAELRAEMLVPVLMERLGLKK